LVDEYVLFLLFLERNEGMILDVGATFVSKSYV